MPRRDTVRQRPHAVAKDETRIGERRRADRDRDHRKEERKARSERVLLLQDLLGRAQISEQRAKDEPARHRVADRLPMTDDFTRRGGDAAEREWNPALARQRLLLAQGKPDGGDQSRRQIHTEDGPPSGHGKDRLPDRRGHHRNEDEDDGDERHDARHLTAFEPVADERERDRARPGHTNALQKPPRQHHRKASRCECEHAAHGEEREPREGRRLAADGVRQRPIEQLTDAEAEEQQRDDELIVVRMLDTERRADRGKRRQDHVDRHRRERGERRHQGDELRKAGGPVVNGMWLSQRDITRSNEETKTNYSLRSSVPVYPLSPQSPLPPIRNRTAR